MNKYILIDNLTANIGLLISGGKKFFAGRIDSQSFEEQIRLVELTVPEINSEGTFEISATAPAGNLDPAFRIDKWLGDDYPSIIYHHGNNERPFDYRKTAKNSFMNIFVKGRDKFEANLIAVRAPFHNGTMKEYREKMLHLGNLISMIVTGSLNSLALRDHILKVLRNHTGALNYENEQKQS